MKKITVRKAQSGDTIAKKVTSGPRGSVKTYTTKSGSKTVTGKITKTADWERSSRSVRDSNPGPNDTIKADRERGGGTDIKGVKRSGEMSSYKKNVPGGVEKGSKYTSTQGGKTTEIRPTKKTVVVKKSSGGVIGKCRGGCN
jgi:hypothetical protein